MFLGKFIPTKKKILPFSFSSPYAILNYETKVIFNFQIKFDRSFLGI